MNIDNKWEGKFTWLLAINSLLQNPAGANSAQMGTVGRLIFTQHYHCDYKKSQIKCATSFILIGNVMRVYHGWPFANIRIILMKRIFPHPHGHA